LNLFLPDNFIGYILERALPEGLFNKVSYIKSGDLAVHADHSPDDVFLAPTLDLNGKKEIYVSGKAAAIIDMEISTGFMYYSGKEVDELRKAGIAGDICKQDIILAKLLFNELYGSDPELKIVSAGDWGDLDALILFGNENFSDDRFTEGVPWSDEITELLDSSFVQYSFASNNVDSLKLLNSYADYIDENAVKIKLNFLKERKYGRESQKYIFDSLNYLNFKMTPDDVESFTNLVRLPFLAGIYKDVWEFRMID